MERAPHLKTTILKGDKKYRRKYFKYQVSLWRVFHTSKFQLLDLSRNLNTNLDAIVLGFYRGCCDTEFAGLPQTQSSCLMQ